MAGAMAGTAMLYMPKWDAKIMTGAMAGTAMLYASKETKQLHTVTLTINNTCNLKCPHCYLQYESITEKLSGESAKKILNSDFKHLAIVGKEPTLNPELVEVLAVENSKLGRKTSIITNGINLHNLSKQTLRSLDYIDISFDGGPETYSKVRAGDFNHVLSNIIGARQQGARSINALHTLYAENIGNIEDMVKVGGLFEFDNIVFSPYIRYNLENAKATRVSLAGVVLPALAGNDKFMAAEPAKLLVSRLDLQSDSLEHFLDEVNRLGLKDKVHYFENPLNNGVIRVSYDGLVLTPNDSVDTLSYRIKGYPISDPKFKNLNEVFYQLLKDNDLQI